MLMSLAVAGLAQAADAPPSIKGEATAPGTLVPPPTDFPAFDSPPVPLAGHYPQPAYPAEAKQAGVEGMVVVQLYISAEGSVVEHRILKAKPEDAGFQAEVERVLPQWRFTPARKNNKPIAAWVQVPVKFKLNTEDQAN